jgi:nucleotide-binding universal stress UspA family protein
MIMDDLKSVLVLVTPTRDCKDVVQDAIQLAGRFHASLYVLDVVHNPFAYTGWNLPMPSFDQEYQRFLEQVRDRLQAKIAEERQRGFPVESIVRQGEPVAQILEVIEEKHIDLLILPSHAEDRIEHYFSGRVAERVIRKMPCSVLLVRQEDTTLCST